MNTFFQEQGFYILAAVIISLISLAVGLMLRPTFEKIGQKLLTWLQGLGSGFEKGYYTHLLEEYRVMAVRGRKTKAPVSLELERVYVSLRTQLPEIELAQQGRPAEALSIGRAMTRAHRLVIIGGPGSGKTTLLHYLLLTYARRQTRPRLDLADQLLPIFVPLRQLKSVLAQPQRCNLPDYLTDYYTRLGLAPPPGFFEQQLKAGQALVLLDGLDEVADQSERVQMAEWVDMQVSIYTRNRFIVTSRPAGYDEAALKNSFLRLEVQDFDRADVAAFCQNWCLAVELATQNEDNDTVRRKAAGSAADLIAAIDKNPAVQALAVNPLLLSIIALVHRYRATLPRRRVELYAECVDVLLGKWDEAKGLAGQLTESQKRAVLQPIALYLHQQNSRELDAAALTGQLKKHLPAVGGRPQEAALFLQEVRDRSGLLLEQDLNLYTFSHLTFQEYLVARELADNGPEELLLHHAGQEWWQEVTLLYTGLKDATSVVKSLLALEDAERHAPLLLAGRCLLDAQKIEPPVKAAVLAQLESLFNTGSGRPFLEAGQVLAELAGDQALLPFLRVAGGANENRRNAAIWALEQMLHIKNEVQQQQNRRLLVQIAFDSRSDLTAPAMQLLAGLAAREAAVKTEYLPRLYDAAFTPETALVEPALAALTTLARQDEAVAGQFVPRLFDAAFTPATTLVEPALTTLTGLARQDKAVLDQLLPRLLDIRPDPPPAGPVWGALKELAPQLMTAAFTPNFSLVEPALMTLAELSRQNQALADQFTPRLFEAAFTPDSPLVEPALTTLTALSRQADPFWQAEITNWLQRTNWLQSKVTDRAWLQSVVADRQIAVSQFLVSLLNDDTAWPLAAACLDHLLAEIPGMSVAIARYPVTNAQYRRFIEAGGYDQQKWWSKEGWQWRQKPPSYRQAPATKPRYWDDKEWNQPDCPVVGVSWYEAEAYCAWLSDQANRPYRLPAEKEWQQAAQGGDGREYPWGNEWEAERCNTAEAGPKRTSTSPVGKYSPAGDSPTGCADMSGNVWEWCADWYDKGGNYRVLRGGSWDGRRGFARCVARFRNGPLDSGNSSGFRVVSPS